MIASSSIVSPAGLMDLMSDTALQNVFLQFFRDQFGVELPSTSTDLIDAGILDSLMLVEVVVFIESEFSVTTELDDLEMENFVTVDSMARFVTARQPSPVEGGGQGDFEGKTAAAAGLGEQPAGKGGG
jgi:acyl carrier protein